jgi:hypothetical protein
VTSLLVALILAGPSLPSGSTFRFEDFTVKVEEVASPTPPDVSSGRASRYRTMLRRASKEPPDFAGHYRVVKWGCGTCCSEFAILDLRTGVAWLPNFFIACGYPPGSSESDAALLYRPDSELFVAAGANNEIGWGIYFYRWNGRSLELLKKDGGAWK